MQCIVYDPFEEVAPPTPINEWEAFTSTLQRSMMWDFAGPQKMQSIPKELGQQPASVDVLEAEYRDMLNRHSNLIPIHRNLAIMCYIAAESLSQALMQMDPKYNEMPEEEQLRFRAHNVNIGAAVTNSVLSHLLQDGVIHHGGHF